MAEQDDLRQFIRDIATRHERIWRDESNVLREMVAHLRALREETREDHTAMLRELRDGREESRAQTQALMHILDRLGNGGAAA